MHMDGHMVLMVKNSNDASAVGATYGDSYTNGDAIGLHLMLIMELLTFYKNGVSQGASYTGLTSGPYFFATGGSSTHIPSKLWTKTLQVPTT